MYDDRKPYPVGSAPGDGTFLGWKVSMRRPGGSGGGYNGQSGGVLNDPHALSDIHHYNGSYSDRVAWGQTHSTYYWDTFGFFHGSFADEDQPMLDWLETHGYTVDFCTDLDVHQDTTQALLDPSRYRVLLSIGHDEYWSAAMRSNVESFRNRGGSLAFLSGNIAPWRIHYVDNDTAFYCAKAATNNFSGPDLFWLPTSRGGVGQPEEALTGVSTRNSGVTLGFRWDPDFQTIPVSDPNAPGYTVQGTEHWMFRHSGLHEGDKIGAESYLIGYESDGARFTISNGRAVLDPQTDSVNGTADATPSNFRILGYWQVYDHFPGDPAHPNDATRDFLTGYDWPNVRGDGYFELVPRTPLQGRFGPTMGTYKQAGGGSVFTAATTDWARVARVDTRVDRITRNVLRGFSYPTLVSVYPLSGTSSPELLLQDYGSDVVSYSSMSGLTPTSHTAFDMTGVSRDWKIVGAGLFGATPVTSLLWQSENTNAIAVWPMNGTQRNGAAWFLDAGSAPLDWKIVAVGRLTGSSWTDLLWQNVQTNAVACWQMNGTSHTAISIDMTGVSSDWALVGCGFITGGSSPDLVWQSRTTNALALWRMNGTTKVSSQYFDTVPPTGWKVAAVADVNGDGRAELIFQSDWGQLAVWYLDPTQTNVARVNSAYISGTWWA